MKRITYAVLGLMGIMGTLSIGVANANDVTFNSNGGSEVAGQTIDDNNLISEPSAPTLAGYHFLGWYRDTDFTSKWDFDTDVVTGNMTLYAKWGGDTIYRGITGGVLYISDSGNVMDSGTSINLNTLTKKGSFGYNAVFGSSSSVPRSSYRSSITSVKVIGNVAPTSTAYWFDYFTNCTSMDLYGLDTSNVTSMYYMFGYCDSLTSLDLSHFDTSNVTNMSYMFGYCDSLTSLDVSNFNTSNVTNMSAMLSYLSSLIDLNVSASLNNKISSTSLYNYPLNNSNNRWTYSGTEYSSTSKMKTNVARHYLAKVSITYKDKYGNTISNENFTKYHIYGTETILTNQSDPNFSGFYLNSGFTAESKITSLSADYRGNGTIYANVSQIYRGITGGILYISDSGNVIDSGTPIDLSTLTNKGSFGYNAVFDSYSSVPRYSSRSSITSVKVIGNVAPTSTAYWFYNFTNCTSMDLYGLDTSNVTNMSYMFRYCSSLESLDVSNFDTSKVTNYKYMLSSLSSLVDLNVSASLNNKISSTSLSMPLGNSNNRWTYSGTEYSSTSSMKANEDRHYLAKVSITYKDKGGADFSASTGGLTTYHTYGTETELIALAESGFLGWCTDSVCTPDSKITSLSADYRGNGTIYADWEWINTIYRGITGGVLYISDSGNVIDNGNSIDLSTLINKGSLVYNAVFNSDSEVPRYSYSGSITSVKVVGHVAPTSTAYWFYGLSNCISMDLSGLDTSNVTSMYGMFYNCSSLESLDVGNWNTSNVTDMSYMFYSGSNIGSLDLSNFDTSKVTSYSNMLSKLSSLVDLNVSATLNNNISSTSLYNYPFNKSGNRWIYSGTEYSSISSMVANEARHYLAKVSITYKDEGGANFSATTGGLTTYHTYGTETELIALAESGFLGWYTDSACTPNSKITSLSADYRGNGTIYADWEWINTIYRGITGGVLYISDSNIINYSGTSIDLTTLTNKGAFRDNVKFDSSSSVPRSSSRSSITSVKVIGHVAPTSTAYWFYYLTNCESMDLSELDTSNVTSYNYMLYSLSSLIDLNVSASLNNKISSTHLDMPLGNSNNRWTYSGTMYESRAEMQGNEARHYYAAFQITYKDKYGNQITDKNLAKYHIYGTETILTNPSDSAFSGFYTNSGFTAESKITSISADYRGNATIYADWEGIDLIYRGITGGVLYISDSGNVIDGGNSIDLTTLTNKGSFGYNAVLSSSSIPWYSYSSSITSVKVIGNVAPTSTAYWFYNFTNCTSMDLSGLDTSKVTDMSYMFAHCNSLTSLDVSHFDTSNVTSMYYMFYNCSSLTSLDLSHFDTSNVSNMSYMFDGCSSLESLDVSHFDTSNVTSMYYMFYNCSSLTSLDLSHFDTSNVSNMSWMFSSCNSLTSLDVSNFDTSNVTNMEGMFGGCSSLTSLDVSHFDTSNVSNMSWMFSSCNSLTSLDVSHFDTSNVSNYNYMLYSLSSLVDLNVSASLNNKISSTNLYNYPLNNSNNRWTYSGTEYSSRSSMVANEARHYYAAFQITYKDKGGANFSASTETLPTYHTYKSDTLLPVSIKSGYVTKWYTDSGCTENRITMIGGEDYTGAITLYADYSKYTVTWKDGDTVLMVDEEVDYGEIPQYNGAKPKKGNYTFKGWSPEISALTGTETEVEYVAVWEAPQSSGGGGRRVVTETSSEKEEKNVETKDTETKDVENQEEIQTNETENDTNIINDTPIDTQNNNNTSDDNAQNYSEEMQEAFVFAHQNGITTMPSIGKADMEGGLTRIAMSKMLSQYAINVLGKTPADIEVPDFSDVTNGLDEEYNNGISLAYRLGIMGINIQDFRPYDEVTRAEFGTALSRLLFGLEDGGELYYETHLAKLTNEGIITNNDPDLKELRGYVMIMLMRSAM